MNAYPVKLDGHESPKRRVVPRGSLAPVRDRRGRPRGGLRDRVDGQGSRVWSPFAVGTRPGRFNFRRIDSHCSHAAHGGPAPAAQQAEGDPSHHIRRDRRLHQCHIFGHLWDWQRRIPARGELHDQLKRRRGAETVHARTQRRRRFGASRKRRGSVVFPPQCRARSVRRRADSRAYAVARTQRRENS